MSDEECVIESHKPTTRRAVSLDMLRGLAIVGMVLSATIGIGLPAWMHHAQEPPPSFAYDASLTGITWVDLVFPFFLFAMGAAFPFSIKRRLKSCGQHGRIVVEVLKRALKLAFFAMYVQHFYPYMLSADGGWYAWGWAIVAFALLFPMFMRIPYNVSPLTQQAVKYTAYVAAIALMLLVRDADGTGLSPNVNNPILLILAYQALLGALCYIATAHNIAHRVVLVALLACVSAGATVEGSWQNVVSTWCPAQGLYQFDYIKYLLIVLPGSMAGDWVEQWLAHRSSGEQSTVSSKSVSWWQGVTMCIVSVVVVALTIVCLYLHHELLCLALVVMMLAGGYLVLQFMIQNAERVLWYRLWSLTALLLSVGLLLSPLGGGIKKDPPTLSYLFVTAADASAMLLVFHIICDIAGQGRSISFLAQSGKNPMMAYVVGDLFVMPLLSILGVLQPFMQMCSVSPWLALLQGVVLTSMSVVLTVLTTRLRWFWRT